MGNLQIQPLELKDFSGGITDNFLQGDTSRYAVADNFLITVDHKLDERQGTQLYDPSAFQPENSPTRIAGLFTAINESILFAHVNRNIYVQANSGLFGSPWSAIRGPTGNEAFADGLPTNQVTSAEFQRQVFLASDFGVQPSKVFRDQNNAWRALSPGMPTLKFVPNYPNDASLLAATITLANAIRTSFIAHFNDSSNVGLNPGTSTSHQHINIDKWSLSFLQLVTTWNITTDWEYPGPFPAPVPAPAATDATSLYALCSALSAAYEHHRVDLAGLNPTIGGTLGSRFYHQTIVFKDASPPQRYGINAQLVNSGSLTTPKKAAAFLDDLWTKWYWHQMSPLAHSPDNTVSLMNKYLVATPKIGTIYSDTFTVQVQPNYIDFISLAFWCKSWLTRHASGNDSTGGFMHNQADTLSEVTLPDPTDFDSAALNIFWARWLYGMIHVTDAVDTTHTRVTFTCTAGSANVTAVKTTATGVALTLPVGTWIFAPQFTFTDADLNSQAGARVTASAAGTATLSKTVIATHTITGQYASTSWFHGAFDGNTNFIDTTTETQPTAEQLANFGNFGVDLATWINLGSEFVLALANHLFNGVSHRSKNSMPNESFLFAPNGNPFFIPTAVQYGYSALYRYKYTVEPNGLNYLDQGTPTFSSPVLTCPSFPVGTIIPVPNATLWPEYNTQFLQQNPAAIVTGIKALVNTASTNYDTVNSVVPYPTDRSQTGFFNNLTIELFRTINGGTTFFALDSLTNTDQDYNDITNESSPIPGTDELDNRKVLYTSGGVVANDLPPQCKYIHAFGNFMYYGAITDTGQFFPQRIRQSIQFQPDSAPLTFFDDLEDELTGISSTRSNVIAFCRNSIYRMSGSFSSTGQGFMTHDRISDQMGCLSAKSIVKTEIGVFYAGTDGFYYTDGYQVIKVSLELDQTYFNHTRTDDQKNRIYGSYDKLTRRVWWSMQSQPYSGDNDVFFIFYLNYGVKPSGVFTKALTTQSWKPSSHVFFQGRQIIGDTRGYLFKSDQYTKTDLKIDVTKDPTTWTTIHIPYNWTSCAIDYGTTFKRKWVTRIHAMGQNVGNAAIQINSINGAGASPDGSNSSLPLAPVQYVKNMRWGDPRVVWGDPNCVWKYDGMMDLWRRFPTRSMRSDFKQIQYVPGNFVVYRSDDWPDFAFANVVKSSLTATLVTPSGFTSLVWPLDVVDYSISFDTDNYATTYPITAIDVTSKIITFTDASGTAIDNSTAKWQISGVRKEQKVRITAITIHYGFIGDANEASPGASGASGEGDNS